MSYSELDIEINNRFNELLNESAGNLIAMMRDIYCIEFTSSESRQAWAEKILVAQYEKNGEGWLAAWRNEERENFLAEYPCKVHKTVGLRPEHIPSHFIIYNSSRSLYGQITWGGMDQENIVGRWYAAVDPTDQFSGGFAENNRRLDARILEYVTPDDFKDMVLKYATELYEENGLTFDPIQARKNGDWRALEDNVIDGWREAGF